MMDPLIIGGVGHDNPQQVIVLAGHQVTLHDFRHPDQGGFECVLVFPALAVQGDFHEDVAR